MRQTVLILFLAWGGACASARTPVATPPVHAEMPGGLHWMRNSAEYQALVRQTYALAAEKLEQLVRNETGPWAVALDGDETVIDNTPYQKERAEAGRAFDEESWDAWCRRREAKAIPGAVSFLRRVRELGGRIAIVTNRTLKVSEATRANFESEGILVDVLLMKDKDSKKEGRWRQITDGTTPAGLPPLQIVMWVGDNILDFPGLDQSLRLQPDASFTLFGERYFVLPNPDYGSWTANPKKTTRRRDTPGASRSGRTPRTAGRPRT